MLITDNGHQERRGAADDFPLITFALLTYNQERYVQKAIEGALSQTYPSLEILISDDASDDETYQIVLSQVKNYTGAHKIVLNRNETTLGLCRHVNKIFALASGQMIVVAAGDDISFPSRVMKIYEVLRAKSPLLIHSRAILIDGDGRPVSNVNLPYEKFQRIMASPEKAAISGSLYLGATGAWNKKLFDQYGPLKYDDAFEDLVLGFRAALENGVVFIDEPLIYYRYNVGWSAKAVKAWDLRGQIAWERKHVAMMLAVFRQRLADAECNGTTSDDIQALLRSRIERYKRIESVMNSRFACLLVCMIGAKKSVRWAGGKLAQLTRGVFCTSRP
jgi:glycosyltransferase involved in cell wall biosynthesis